MRQEEESADLYEGKLELKVESATDFVQMLNLEACLRRIPDLRMLSIGGSRDRGTRIVVQLERPIPVVRILKNLPPVQLAAKDKQGIRMVLKASEA